jgi:hypothetical protein
MPLILGIVASGNYPRITGSYESIATVSVTSNTATISFTSIPSTYKHLQIRYIARDNRATTGFDNMFMKFNGGASATYSWHRLVGSGTAASSTASPSSGDIALSEAAISRGNNASGIFAPGIIDILDYTDTNKYTTVRALHGGDSNGGGSMLLTSGLWYGSTNAITSIDFTAESASSFVQYSHFALYGIKG